MLLRAWVVLVLFTPTVEEFREDGRAVILVGDLNLIADNDKDAHPGLRCKYSGEWLRRCEGELWHRVWWMTSPCSYPMLTKHLRRARG
jgi:hypothetical protein